MYCGGVEYYYIRKVDPDYKANIIDLNSIQNAGKINLAYIKFKGNEDYRPTSYYFYLIYTD